MTKPQAHWQHVNATSDHAATPPASARPAAKLPTYTRGKCTQCKRAIYVTPANAGPESLKALMRF